MLFFLCFILLDCICCFAVSDGILYMNNEIIKNNLCESAFKWQIDNRGVLRRYVHASLTEIKKEQLPKQKIKLFLK